MRFFSFPLLVFLTLAAVAGCFKPGAQNTPAAAKSGPTLRIGISFQELDNPYFAVMKQAFDEAGRSIGAEMFVTGHTSGEISKFKRNGSNWDADGVITTGVHMGDIQVVGAPVPEPASMAVLGLGALSLLRRRSKKA